MKHTLLPSLSGKRIFVGLSGGVDSAVSAALLQRAGAEVIGVFIKGWYPPGMPCTWADDRRDAMRVAARLQIPFHTLDASAEYKKGVIDYLLSEYKAGRTPNPDVMCNREVKFGAFFEFATRNGADFIATGHYAQTHDGNLIRGIDASKDQSYFLWAVPKEALAKTLFPVGGMQKSNVRELAVQFNVPVAQKKDSQGICFLGSISVDDFLREEFGTRPGNVLAEDGTVLGTHDSALLHTLGERIAFNSIGKDVGAGPWYVRSKDIDANTLTVSQSHTSEGNSAKVMLSEANWFINIQTEAEVVAQYRYHGPLVAGTIDQTHAAFTPHAAFPEPLAPGQSLVLYRENTCIGGGIIR